MNVFELLNDGAFIGWAVLIMAFAAGIIKSIDLTCPHCLKRYRLSLKSNWYMSAGRECARCHRCGKGHVVVMPIIKETIKMTFRTLSWQVSKIGAALFH